MKKHSIALLLLLVLLTGCGARRRRHHGRPPTVKRVNIYKSKIRFPQALLTASGR